MKPKVKHLPKYTIAVFLFVVLVIFAKSTFAQTQSIDAAIAANLEVKDQVQPGDIVSSQPDGLKKSTIAYDSKMYGVVLEAATISLGEKTQNTTPVLSSGTAPVKVSTKNGSIEVGDFITTSDTPGVGQKATASGYVLGKALAKYDASSEGTVPVQINITFYQTSPKAGNLLGSLLGSLSLGLQNSQNFPIVLRYISAAVIGAITFIIIFFSFGRLLRSGIEALGRNPLAKKTIIAGMLLNALMIVILALAGLGIAFAIVTL